MLATVNDVTARLGRPLTSEEALRVPALLADVTGLIEDHCGRDLVRQEGQALTLPSYGGSTLPIPGRYSAALSVSAVHHGGQQLDGWALVGRQLDREAWPVGPIVLIASWGYLDPPASLRAVACAEVIRWLALSPGIESERVGEVEVRFSGGGVVLSSSTKNTLRPYRRAGLASIPLQREASIISRWRANARKY
ncbi:phage gp6-like head-tail connector protein [Streptomyces sp. NBC_00237]|uniref:phage gp6-like head-tail connector protein n=1 Tax=Streptomyces sp. NBC_00237 TaxID=2975687 RepID=UPI0022538FCF|nr:phage gp6-like head-tail connector protein [Streptomyces sp. NBC_00237]MCX5201490.1 phage gp6-like head-tail connector protein [Streptomyces sp. NBC_00237]